MQRLFQFTGPSRSEAWCATNDRVMGGRSEGDAQLVEDGMVFSGTLSLENNGGFSLIYAPKSFDLSNYEGIRLLVFGDGRNYQLRLQTDAMFRAGEPVSFAASFAAEPNKWIEVFVPFDELEPSWRGSQLSGYTFHAHAIQRFGILLGDQQAGPFRLTIGWMAADHEPTDSLEF